MMRLMPLAPLAGLLCATVVKDAWPVRFTDAGAKAGLAAADVSGDTTNKRYILEMNGSGVAFIDYNRDGYVDLFVVNGTRLDHGAGTPSPVSHLYRNNGNGTFTDATVEAGVMHAGWG